MSLSPSPSPYHDGSGSAQKSLRIKEMRQQQYEREVDAAAAAGYGVREYALQLGAVEEHAAPVGHMSSRDGTGMTGIGVTRADAAVITTMKGGGHDGGGDGDDDSRGGSGDGGDASLVFRAYFAARADGRALLSPAFEEAALAAAQGMPAFRGLPVRHISQVFSSASLELHLPGAVIVQEGSRGECMCVVVGGEVGLFQKHVDPKANKLSGIAPSPNLWDPALLTRPGIALAVSKPTKTKRPVSAVPGVPSSGGGSGGAGDPNPLIAQSSAPTISSTYVSSDGDYGGNDFGLVDAYAHAAAAARAAAEEEEDVARAMGAPRGSGRLARLVRSGEVFGERAVLRRGGGEARAATAVAVRHPVALLTLRKWAYDAVLRSVVGQM
jgi:CRP-like cAMP-binding protein